MKKRKPSSPKVWVWRIGNTVNVRAKWRNGTPTQVSYRHWKHNNPEIPLRKNEKFLMKITDILKWRA